MNKAPILILALTLAACGGKTASDSRQPVVPQDTRPAVVKEETLPAPGLGNAAGAASVASSPHEQALVQAIKSIPGDKRRLLGALLECEEGKLPAPVAEADRPAFMEKGLSTLNADPSAVAHCRVGATVTQPAE